MPRPIRANRVAGVSIERDAEMQTRDATILRADIYRPDVSEHSRPVLLLRTPYDKQMADDGTYQHPAWYAREGFIVAIQDVRGRGRSDGTFWPFVNEGRDGADAVEWAARLPGSNGRVGMYGASYAGFVQLAAAVERPPSLNAIAPAVTSADLHSHWTFEGGALNLAFVASWAANLAAADAVRAGRVELAKKLDSIIAEPQNWFRSAAPNKLDPLPDAALFFVEWLNHPTKDDFWEALSVDTRLDRIEIPTLHIAGWFDIFLEGSTEAFTRLTSMGRLNQRVILGPWMHYPWGNQASGARFGSVAQGTGFVDRMQVRFFREHLTPERPNHHQPVEPQARVQYFVLYADAWQSTEDWPPPDAQELCLYLDSGGSANGLGGDGRLRIDGPGKGPADFYNYIPAIPVPALGGHSCCDPDIQPMGMVDQTPVEQLTRVLVYTTDRLAESVIIAGRVRVEIFVASDAVSADYVARLCVVDDGGSWNIAEGVTRLPPTSFHTPGKPLAVSISLRSVACQVDAGKRLRLDLTSGSFPMWDSNPQTGDPPEATPPAAGFAALHAVFHNEQHPSRLILDVLNRENRMATVNGQGKA